MNLLSPKLSVIIPVYNEKNTLERIVDLIASVPIEKEIILVDDGSRDGTREIMQKRFLGRDGFKVIFHEKNLGKGSAIRSAIGAASGKAIILQDADLEYNPMDYLRLLTQLERPDVPIVYGSRFMKGRVTTPWHRFVNYFLTSLTNVLFDAKLTDMETCYKLFRADVLKSIPLESKGFEIEVELTAKSLAIGHRIIEVPIDYKGRNFHEGKKIGWTDGLKAIFAMLRYRFFR